MRREPRILRRRTLRRVKTKVGLGWSGSGESDLLSRENLEWYKWWSLEREGTRGVYYGYIGVIHRVTELSHN